MGEESTLVTDLVQPALALATGNRSATAPPRRARASRTRAVAMRRSWLVATARVTRRFRMASLNPCHQVTAVGVGARLVWVPLAKAALTSVLGEWKFGPTAQPASRAGIIIHHKLNRRSALMVSLLPIAVQAGASSIGCPVSLPRRN